VVGKSDLSDLGAHGNAREQLLGVFIMQEQRRALGVQHPVGFGYHALQQLIEVDPPETKAGAGAASLITNNGRRNSIKRQRS